MTHKRKPPWGIGRLSEAGSETNSGLRDTPDEAKLQAEIRRARFARAAVFLEFRGRDAKAIDYDGFKDRRPDESPLRRPPGGWF